MKILHLASQFLPEYSGASTRLYNLLSELPFEVDLMVNNRIINGTIIPLKKEKFGNINVHRVSLDRPGIWNQLPFRYFSHLSAKVKMSGTILKEGKIKLIHAHETKVVSGEVAMAVARKKNIPYICEIHALRTENISGAWKGIHKKYADYRSKQILHSCDHVITLTNSLKDWISRYYGIPCEKITVVPNGVKADIFCAGKNTERVVDIKEKLNISGYKVVMYSGYMDQINGINDLINVIPSIVNVKKDVCFLFVGNGPERGKIESLVKEFPENVKFIPSVSYEEMPVFYELCDIFIIPRPSNISTETLVPLKLLEAMAMEKIIFVSNVGGMTELIKHGENGYLYQKNDMESFKKGLFNVLEDHGKVGKKAREGVIKEYTWAKSATILENVYKKYL